MQQITRDELATFKIPARGRMSQAHAKLLKRCIQQHGQQYVAQCTNLLPSLLGPDASKAQGALARLRLGLPKWVGTQIGKAPVVAKKRGKGISAGATRVAAKGNATGRTATKRRSAGRRAGMDVVETVRVADNAATTH